MRDYPKAIRDGKFRVAPVTDDTQMTLFTVEGLIRMFTRMRLKGIGPAYSVIHRAYWRWLDTQERSSPDLGVTDGWLRTQRWLYARRAPGATCLAALRANRARDPIVFERADGNAIGEPARNHSKGCGAVMRSAPFGFTTDDESVLWALTCEAASYTHGHPTGQHASAALALIVSALNAGRSLPDAVNVAIRFAASQRNTEETVSALEHALALASRQGPPTWQHVAELGQGWVAEEALAIAVFAALAYPQPDQVRDALALAITHGGDSDSTGAICGNILGTAHGSAAIPADLAFQVEGRGTILELADDLAYELTQGSTPYDEMPIIMTSAGKLLPEPDPGIHDQSAWFTRYPPN